MERGPAFGGQPRTSEQIQLLTQQRAVSNAGDVGTDQRLVQRRRELGDDGGFVGDELEELRAPGRQSHHVDQRQGPVTSTVEQVSAQ